jgi:hypothetical protein
MNITIAHDESSLLSLLLTAYYTPNTTKVNKLEQAGYLRLTLDFGVIINKIHYVNLWAVSSVLVRASA